MWPLKFISESDLTQHVKKTIAHYGAKLEPFDLKKFNKNIIDPIKLIFDKTVYNLSWEEVIKSEIFRQRDKANNNDIGYFHQHIFFAISQDAKCRLTVQKEDGMLYGTLLREFSYRMAA